MWGDNHIFLENGSENFEDSALMRPIGLISLSNLAFRCGRFGGAQGRHERGSIRKSRN
jgi:hypothetical protein